MCQNKINLPWNNSEWVKKWLLTLLKRKTFINHPSNHLNTWSRMTNIPAYSKMLALDQSSSINVRRRNLRFANHERKSKEMAFVFHINWKAKTLINGQIQPFRVLIISSIISFELQAALVILIGLYFFQWSQKQMFPGLWPEDLAYF